MNPVSFADWRRKFEAEMAAIKAEKDKAARLDEKKRRLTGKTLYSYGALMTLSYSLHSY